MLFHHLRCLNSSVTGAGLKATAPSTAICQSRQRFTNRTLPGLHKPHEDEEEEEDDEGWLLFSLLSKKKKEHQKKTSPDALRGPDFVRRSITSVPAQ